MFLNTVIDVYQLVCDVLKVEWLSVAGSLSQFVMLIKISILAFPVLCPERIES